MRAAIYILVISSAAAAVAAALTVIAWFAPGDFHHDLAALVNKRALLESRPPPRLIFIGGSNLVTMRGAEIEREINHRSRIRRAVVNLGLWGGLSIGRYLEEIFPLLGPGDIVIVCQEYATLLDRNYFRYIGENVEARRFFLLMSPRAHILRGLHRGGMADVISDIVILNQLKMKTYLSILLERNFSHRVTGGFYRYGRYYTDYGDRIRPFRVTRPLNASGARFSDPSEDDLVYLKEFSDRARDNSIRVLVAFPPFPEPEYRLNRGSIASLGRLLREDLGLELLNAPEDVLFPEECFADSVNHLTPPCEEQRSVRLLRRLGPHLR